MLLPPPKPLLRQAKLRAPTSLPSRAIPPLPGILGLAGHWAGWTIGVPKAGAAPGRRVLTGWGPRADPLSTWLPWRCPTAEEEPGFCLPSSARCTLHCPSLYICYLWST